MACSILPPNLRNIFEQSGALNAEEIRLRMQRPVCIIRNGKEHQLKTLPVTERDIAQILEKVTGASMHAVAGDLSKGFIGFKGLRIGVCGTAVISNGELVGFRNYSSLAIRIPHECHGICAGFIDKLCDKGFESTLIISPPGIGKTTLLRELVLILSNRGLRISVLDERNELSASDNGCVAFSLGRCSDILVGVPKAKGAEIMLRGMNPQIIAMDEISGEEDKSVIEQIIGCGVSIMASAHGKSMEDMLKRKMYRDVMDSGCFKNLITISREGDKRRYSLESI